VVATDRRSTFVGIPRFRAKGIGLLGTLPDFVIRVVNANLSHGITLDLDGELKAFPVIANPRFVGVFLGFHILIAIERVRSTEMLRNQSGIGVGVRQGPVLAGAKLEASACRRSLAYLAGPADLNPCSNHVLGKLRRRSGSGGLVIEIRFFARRLECEREQTENSGEDDWSGNGESFPRAMRFGFGV
jgi:hypothetical protein